MDELGIASRGLVPERTTRELRRPLARILTAVLEEQQSSSGEQMSMTQDEIKALAQDAAYRLSEFKDWAGEADLKPGQGRLPQARTRTPGGSKS
jgi:hypothetical protein